MATLIVVRGPLTKLRDLLTDRYQKMYKTIPIHSIVEGLGNVETLLGLSKNVIVTGPLSSREEMSLLDRAVSETASTMHVYRVPGDGEMYDYPGEVMLDDLALKELLGEQPC